MGLFLVTSLKSVLYGSQWTLWHPTIAFGWFALLLFASLLRGGNGLLHVVWGRSLNRPESFWRRLNAWTGGLYVALAIANVVVANAVPFGIWLHLKNFGPLFVLLGFSVWAARHLTNNGRAASVA
ncbi:septation protein IspZ [Paraburkholderia guartelaensis]